MIEFGLFLIVVTGFLAVISSAINSSLEKPTLHRNRRLSAFNTWTQTTASTYAWHSIDSDSTGQYLIACSNAVKGVYISSTYGVTWEPSATPTPFDYTGVASSASGAKLFAVVGGTAAGEIYGSPDTGLNWVASPAPSSLWNSVTCDSSGTYIVAVVYSSILATPGGIYYSTNSGVAFILSDAPTANWNGVTSDSTGAYVVAVISNSVAGTAGIYRSTNYGANWLQVSTWAYEWSGVASDSTGNLLVAVSQDGSIATSSDGGGVWSLTTNDVYKYTCVSSDSSGMFLNIGITGTTNGGVLRSTDGGNTWEFSNAPMEDYTAISSDASGSYVFAVTANAGIWGVIYSTQAPSAHPTTAPVIADTIAPTIGLTNAPIIQDTVQPTSVPSTAPVAAPTAVPSQSPVSAPSNHPSGRPSAQPSGRPSASPVTPSSTPSVAPSSRPTSTPTAHPSALPSSLPSGQPSASPSARPSCRPSSRPSPKPSVKPTAVPTALPSALPTVIPTVQPSVIVTDTPTYTVTAVPSVVPTPIVSAHPTASPSNNDTSTLVLSFTSNVTLVGLASTLFNQASQMSLVATNAEIMRIAETDVSYVGSVAVSSSVELLWVIDSLTQGNKRSLRVSATGAAPLATSSAVVITRIQVAMASTVFPSPEALYTSLTSALSDAVANGEYDLILGDSAVVYGASQLTDAAATSVSFSPESVSLVSSAPTARPTSEPKSSKGKNLQLVLEIVSITPGVMLMLVGAFVIHFRRPKAGLLNELKTLPAEYMHLFVRGVTLVLAVNLLLTSSLSINDPTFVLLFASRLFILALCLLFFVFFAFPAKEELNSVTGTSLLIRTDVLQQNGAVSVYSVVIVMGLFDISMLRYLPWFRTNFTAVMDGYPNKLLVRCSLYGTFFSSVIQTAAVLPTLLGHHQTSTKTAIKIIALLVFNVINIVRSFMSIILHMKKVKDVNFKLAIVNENDVAALADFVNSSERSHYDSSDLRSTESRSPIAAHKIASLLAEAEARSVNSRSQASVAASELNAQNLGEMSCVSEFSNTNPLHAAARAKYPKYQHDEDNMSEMTEEVDVDERGIMFATKIHFADETVDILRDQVRLAGLRPLEFIPLAHLKGELEKLFESANSGVAYDTDRLDYLLLCLDHNPEYKAEQAEANRAWRAEIAPFLNESLEIMQAFIPPTIFKCSEAALVQEFNYSKVLAKRILGKKCLWLVRITPTDIDRMHIAELNGRFNPEAQNLDIVEAAAIFAVLPAQFSHDADRRKTRWRASVEQNLKTLYKQYLAGTLAGPRKRNPAYKNQVPSFDGRETMHEMSATSNENAFAPRTSFMNMNLALPRQPSIAGSVSSTGTGGGSSSSYVQQISASLKNSLFQRPRLQTGMSEAEDVLGSSNRSSLTMLPSRVNDRSPVGGARKTATTTTSTSENTTESKSSKSSAFGSELTRALAAGGRNKFSNKSTDDDIL